MILPITALFAGILVLWYVYLSVKTSFARGEHQISLGTGEPGGPFSRIARVHGNAAEYIAAFITVLALLEFHGLRAEVLYVLGGAFVLGRYVHRQGILLPSVRRRIWAMQLTLWPLAIGALILLYTWFTHTFLLG